MSKMFRNMMAKEEFEDGVTDTEMPESEIASIDNEAVEAVDEMEEDNHEVEAVADGIDDASQDVEELEAIEGSLEDAVGNEDHPGLEEVAVESIKATLRMIQRNNGLDTRSTQRLVAKENFTGSVSTRRSNTKAVLLSVSETISNMWEKLKSALKSLWEAIKKFWNKHFSTIGRLRKAIDAMKKKVKSQKGMPDYAKELKPSASLKKAFFSKEDVSYKLADKFTSDAVECSNYSIKYIEDMTGQMKDLARASGDQASLIAFFNKATFVAASKQTGAVLTFGSNESPLIGGFYGEVELESETNDDKLYIKAEFKKESSDIDYDSESRDLTIASKSELEKLMQTSLDAVKTLEKLGSNFTKANKELDNALKDVDKNITGTGNAADDPHAQALASAMKVYRVLGTLIPNISAKTTSVLIQTLKANLAFAKSSLANYRQSGK